MSAPDPITLDYMGGRPGYVLGSITEGSSVLTLPPGHGFLPGDRVIVEVGGEAGGGEPNTIGVGGTFPSVSFPDLATLEASGEPAEHPTDGSIAAAYAADTGAVRRWASVAEEWIEPAYPYSDTMIPIALVATVDAVDGTQVTLNATASATATNARVFGDCIEILKLIVRCPGASVRVPDSAYASSNRVDNSGFESGDIDLFGDGKDSGSELFSPKGCGALVVQVDGYDDVTVRDMALGRLWTGGCIYFGFTGYAGPSTMGRPLVYLSLGQRLSARNLRLYDGVTNEVVIASSLGEGGSEIVGCDVVRSVLPRMYVGWALQLMDCNNGRIADCTATGPGLFHGLELFGGANCTLEDITGVNAVMALNTTDAPTLRRLDLSFQAGSGTVAASADSAWTGNVAILFHNNNFGHDYGGGSLSDSVFTVEGDVGASIQAYGYDHHALLSVLGDPFTIGPDVVMNVGAGNLALSAESGTPAQELILDGVTTDGAVRVNYATIRNTTAAILDYCPDDVTLESGNSFGTTETNCS